MPDIITRESILKRQRQEIHRAYSKFNTLEALIAPLSNISREVCNAAGNCAKEVYAYDVKIAEIECVEALDKLEEN